MTTLQIIGVVLLSVPVLFALLLIGFSMAYPLTAEQKAQLKRERRRINSAPAKPQEDILMKYFPIFFH